MIMPILFLTIFEILIVWFFMPRDKGLMIHTQTVIIIFECLSDIGRMLIAEESSQANDSLSVCYQCFWLDKYGRDVGGHHGDAVHFMGCLPRGGDWIFFFSSRRRHTRCSRDWSSDVCSSDLGAPELTAGMGLRVVRGPDPHVSA